MIFALPTSWCIWWFPEQQWAVSKNTYLENWWIIKPGKKNLDAWAISDRHLPTKMRWCTGSVQYGKAWAGGLAEQQQFLVEFSRS